MNFGEPYEILSNLNMDKVKEAFSDDKVDNVVTFVISKLDIDIITIDTLYKVLCWDEVGIKVSIVSNLIFIEVSDDKEDDDIILIYLIKLMACVVRNKYGDNLPRTTSFSFCSTVIDVDVNDPRKWNEKLNSYSRSITIKDLYLDRSNNSCVVIFDVGNGN